jgi:hypothetical protein
MVMDGAYITMATMRLPGVGVAAKVADRVAEDAVVVLAALWIFNACGGAAAMLMDCADVAMRAVPLESVARTVNASVSIVVGVPAKVAPVPLTVTVIHAGMAPELASMTTGVL